MPDDTSRNLSNLIESIIIIEDSVNSIEKNIPDIVKSDKLESFSETNESEIHTEMMIDGEVIIESDTKNMDSITGHFFKDINSNKKIAWIVIIIVVLIVALFFHSIYKADDEFKMELK